MGRIERKLKKSKKKIRKGKFDQAERKLNTLSGKRGVSDAKDVRKTETAWRFLEREKEKIRTSVPLGKSPDAHKAYKKQKGI